MMIYIWRFFYFIGLSVYSIFINTAALLGHSKAKEFINGRKSTLKEIKELNSKEGLLFWMHCASLGEFEQGRPIIEGLKERHPSAKILISFFSPSGYKYRKDYALADKVVYLPLDFPWKVKAFIDTLQPTVAIFVKYEYWYHFFEKMVKIKIPTYLIAASFRPDQFLFKNIGKPYLKLFKQLRGIYVQQEDDLILLNNHGLDNVSVAGDPRIDSVIQAAQKTTSIEAIDIFKGDDKLLVLGSPHEGDDSLFISLFHNIPYDWKIIIAPHHIDNKRIEQVESLLSPDSYFRYSDFNEQNAISKKVLIINNIGMLSRIYAYADIVYIGGGFGDGIHNTLEAAVFGVPIIIGPKYQKFPEAVTLVQKGGFKVVHDAQEFQGIFGHLQIAENRSRMGTICKSYIIKNKGAGLQILNNMRIDI